MKSELDHHHVLAVYLCLYRSVELLNSQTENTCGSSLALLTGPLPV